MRAGRLLAALLLVGALGAGCSSSETSTEQEAVYALYGEQRSTRLSPYPSNRYARPDPTTRTGLRVDLRAETTADPVIGSFGGTVDALDRLDGFSTIGPLIVGFSADIEPAGVENAMALVDVDDTSPTRGQRMPVTAVSYTTTGTDAETPDYTLLVHPMEPLRQRTRYAFVVSDGVTSTKGVHVRATEETRRLLDDEPGEYAESVRRALSLVRDASGFDNEHLTLATVFTTRSVRDTTEAMAIDRRAAPPPKLTQPFTVERAVAPPDKRVRFVARFEAPEYRRPKPLGTWDVGPDDKARVVSTASLELFLVFSDATKSGPRPVVIYGHGLGSDKDGVWGTAERLADLGVVVIGIDGPEHGSRSDPPIAPGQTNLVQSVKGFFAADPEAQTFDMERVRDNFRQMALDQLELVRLVTSLGALDLLPVGAPDGVPDLDPSKILYLGQSFGSVLGPTIGALAPEIRAACWTVGGDGLLTLMRDSRLFNLLVSSFRPPGTPDADVAKFFAVTQAIVDPGDPANYARFATREPLPGVPSWRPLDVLLQEVENDAVVPNTATEVLARAAGLPQIGRLTHEVPGVARLSAPISRNLASGATGGLAQFETIGGEVATHGELIFSSEARSQYVEFFRGALADRATIIDPIGP